MPKNGIRDYILGIIGVLAAAAVIGSLKLYSDVQVHMSLPMHTGADKRLDGVEDRLTYIENEFKRNDDYHYTMIQILAEKNRITMPSRNR